MAALDFLTVKAESLHRFLVKLLGVSQEPLSDWVVAHRLLQVFSEAALARNLTLVLTQLAGRFVGWGAGWVRSTREELGYGASQDVIEDFKFHFCLNPV